MKLVKHLTDIYGAENKEAIIDFLDGYPIPKTQLELSALEDELELFLDNAEND